MSWEPVLPYAILLQESKSVFGYPSSFSSKQVLRGTLLARLSAFEVSDLTHHCGITTPLNFKVLEEPAVKLRCTVNNVFLLSYNQKEFLLAIPSAIDRFEAIYKLGLAEKLTERSTVYVSIPTLRIIAKGIVRYIGKLPGERGTKFGIELLVCKQYSYIM